MSKIHYDWYKLCQFSFILSQTGACKHGKMSICCRSTNCRDDYRLRGRRYTNKRPIVNMEVLSCSMVAVFLVLCRPLSFCQSSPSLCTIALVNITAYCYCSRSVIVFSPCGRFIYSISDARRRLRSGKFSGSWHFWYNSSMDGMPKWSCRFPASRALHELGV